MKRHLKRVSRKALVMGFLYVIAAIFLSGCGKSEKADSSEKKEISDENRESSNLDSSEETSSAIDSTEETEAATQGQTEQQTTAKEVLSEVQQTKATTPETQTSLKEPETELVTEAFHVTDTHMTMYASQDVNVRKGPSANYERIGSLSTNQEVTVTGQADTGWYRISYRGGEAYVSNNYLTSEKTTYQEPPSTEKTTQAAEKPAVNQTQPSDSKSAKREQARVVAQQIADSVYADSSIQTDVERVAAAAYIVSCYCAEAVYTTEGENYYEAYGVFISKEFSCAGATRALGMVLSCMGYEWEHVNENQWTHQWCRLKMDGQIGWADGQIGYAGYGPHPVEDQL